MIIVDGEGARRSSVVQEARACWVRPAAARPGYRGGGGAALGGAAGADH